MMMCPFLDETPITDNTEGTNTTPTTHELSTISSYYYLYKFHLAPDEDPKRNNPTTHNSTTTTTTSTNKSPPSSKQHDESPFWVEDKWTQNCFSDAEQKLRQSKDKCDLSSSYLIQKYELESDKHWDQFYERNKTNFFRDRHYLHKSFPNDLSRLEEKNECTIYEIGCGVGNNVLPLLDRTASVHVTCFDFSTVAIEYLKRNSLFQRAERDGRAAAHVWDITKHDSLPEDCYGKADIAMLLFCLSAISPDKMLSAARNIALTLKPGGVLLFRDYGRYDEAQMKLGTSKRKRLGENCYVKHDGTRCYYFELDDLRRLFGDDEGGAGLEILEAEYIRRVYTNRKDGERRRRVWVQARFRRPIASQI